MPSSDPSSIAAAALSRNGGPRGPKLSEILFGIANDTSRDRVSVADLLAVMQDRAVGTLMFVFALPNVLPTPPGTSAVLGAPLIFLTAQLALGLKPWLPRLIADRSMARSDFAAVVNKAAPWLAKAESLLRPRLGRLVEPPAEYAIGLVCFLLAVILFLPIPLGNMLPALAICLLSLSVVERDGVWIVAGLATAVASLVVIWGVLYAIVTGVLFFIANVFN
ncbi:exopolysaccharide biosynthesis protein [Methylopila henanensis]|uniref:Exopolysaccharide biosynthesis protein n=1 Tax=Methylopila henanensis TaxID=873516 RepID=A0ABW4KA66_9HYPH